MILSTYMQVLLIVREGLKWVLKQRRFSMGDWMFGSNKQIKVSSNGKYILVNSRDYANAILYQVNLDSDKI